ncbi:TPA: TIGR04219 family outer membrane beta-barrel protein, partial [Acinetobacter baumannii]
MKILKLSFLALGMGLSGFAQADFIGVKGDVGYWFYDGKANMSSQSP